MSKHKRKSGNQFVMHHVAMLRSPAFQVLSRAGLKVLTCIEIEHCAHGGQDNGRLPVTYEDFCRLGIDRDSVGPAIREVAALGFIEITERGIAGNGEHRKPNLFRATYLGGKAATNEWSAIQSVAEAKAIAIKARLNKPKRRRAASKNTSRGFSHSQSGKPRPKNDHSQSGFSGLKGKKHQSGFSGLLSRYSSHLATVDEGVRRPLAPAAPAPAKPKTRKRKRASTRAAGGEAVTFHRTNQTGDHHGEDD
jgi:hypothetical protein